MGFAVATEVMVDFALMGEHAGTIISVVGSKAHKKILLFNVLDEIILLVRVAVVCFGECFKGRA